jgi:hypothetical protein
MAVACCGTAAHVERLVRAWRYCDRVEDRRKQLARSVACWADEDGMVIVRARLTPEQGAVVQKALEAASDRLYQEGQHAAPPDNMAEEVTFGQRQADALTLIAESALNAGFDRGSTGDRYQVVLHVQAAPALIGDEPRHVIDLADAGIGVSAETSRRVSCDASVVVIREDADGAALEVGRKTRTIPSGLRRALASRDRHCVFPGCSARRCDAHHVEHWAGGGRTSLDNLVLLCRRHHTLVHDGGISVEAHDGEMVFRRPDGRPIELTPATSWSGGRLVPGGVGARSLRVWDGTPFNVVHAVDVLHPRANGAGRPGCARDPANQPDSAGAPARMDKKQLSERDKGRVIVRGRSSGAGESRRTSASGFRSRVRPTLVVVADDHDGIGVVQACQLRRQRQLLQWPERDGVEPLLAQCRPPLPVHPLRFLGVRGPEQEEQLPAGDGLLERRVPPLAHAQAQAVHEDVDSGGVADFGDAVQHAQPILGGIGGERRARRIRHDVPLARGAGGGDDVDLNRHDGHPYARHVDVELQHGRGQGSGVGNRDLEGEDRPAAFPHELVGRRIDREMVADGGNLDGRAALPPTRLHVELRLSATAAAPQLRTDLLLEFGHVGREGRHEPIAGFHGVERDGTQAHSI